jgi:hypothetical protein
MVDMVGMVPADRTLAKLRRPGSGRGSSTTTPRTI